MERLKTLYPKVNSLEVLNNGEKDLLLLVDSYKVVYKKQNLSFITKHSLKTNIVDPTYSDVVRLVRNLNVDLYSTDIESITNVPGGYLIKIHRDCLIHYGSFKIKYREYAK